MALYYDAASILSSSDDRGSLKSRIYGSTSTKSKPAQIYALIVETSKRDSFLKEVIDNAQLLSDEPKLTPLLALLLCHDHFFTKSGIAAPQKHPLRQCVEKHRSRLQSEFTRARIRRKCGSIDTLKAFLDGSKAVKEAVHPRWVRVNSVLVNDLDTALQNLPGVQRVNSLREVLDDGRDGVQNYCLDRHVPNLYAFWPTADLTRTQPYEKGALILQDKASCFPAYLLLGNEDKTTIGDVLDGCAAPGNKTTHLAAILSFMKKDSHIFACERDRARSKTLVSMTRKAGAGNMVQVLERQDFLALDPHESRFSNVTHLLLDPSCSGSGILRRENIPKLALPEARQSQKPVKITQNGNAKKRKREESGTAVATEIVQLDTKEQEAEEEETPESQTSADRLVKLSSLQTRIVEHAMAFPAASRITYSTCSIHEQENEVVVSRLLKSKIARDGGWKVLSRSEQVEGMINWEHRGVRSGSNEENVLDGDQLEACIRCSPDDGEGTMGFFVCAFTRAGTASNNSDEHDDNARVEEDEWSGFD